MAATATKTPVKAAVKPKAVADQIPDSEAPEYHGEPETISLADVTGESSMMEFDPESLTTEAKEKAEKAETDEEDEDEDADDQEEGAKKGKAEAEDEGDEE